jgi:hypothetical protein
MAGTPDDFAIELCDTRYAELQAFNTVFSEPLQSGDESIWKAFV